MPFSSVEVMNELAQEAVSQIEVRREPGLKLALDDLVTVHVGLLCASRFPSNDGPSDWVCLLQDPYGFGSQPMCRSWMEPYRAIAEAAVVSLEREDRFFSRVAGLSARLIRKVGMQSPVILIDLMLSSTLLMYHLGRWWNQRVENQSTVSPYGPRLLSQPLRNIYRDAVQSWIGYWEEIHIYIDRDVDFKDDELWTEHATRVKVFDLAKRVHDRIFSGSESNFFPIALTTDFIPTGEELDSASQSFTGITMLPFTNPPLEPIGEHLVKWISQYLADRVFADAMARLQRQVGIEPVRDDNKDAFFSDLSMRISSIEASGFTPVILVAGGRRLNYLSPYRLPEDGELPEGFSIRPAVGSSRGLLATLNDVEIYSVPMISSRYLVLPKEYLERLRYQKFSNAIGLAIDRKNESKGKFDLKFTFACEFEVTSDRSFISQPSV